MWKVKHKISKSEIKFGVLSIRHSDGTKEIFDDLPERFKMRFKNEILLERQIAKNRSVWIGATNMKIFKEGDNVNILRFGDEITIE